jgi:hypothetical protein
LDGVWYAVGKAINTNRRFRLVIYLAMIPVGLALGLIGFAIWGHAVDSYPQPGWTQYTAVVQKPGALKPHPQTVPGWPALTWSKASVEVGKTVLHPTAPVPWNWMKGTLFPIWYNGKVMSTAEPMVWHFPSTNLLGWLLAGFIIGTLLLLAVWLKARRMRLHPTEDPHPARPAAAAPSARQGEDTAAGVASQPADQGGERRSGSLDDLLVEGPDENSA